MLFLNVCVDVCVCVCVVISEITHSPLRHISDLFDISLWNLKRLMFPISMDHNIQADHDPMLF